MYINYRIVGSVMTFPYMYITHFDHFHPLVALFGPLPTSGSVFFQPAPLLLCCQPEFGFIWCFGNLVNGIEVVDRGPSNSPSAVAASASVKTRSLPPPARRNCLQILRKRWAPCTPPSELFKNSQNCLSVEKWVLLCIACTAKMGT